MKLSRIKELKQALADESISLSEIKEIEEAFNLIPENELKDIRENAMASDMIDELEERGDDE